MLYVHVCTYNTCVICFMYVRDVVFTILIYPVWVWYAYKTSCAYVRKCTHTLLCVLTYVRTYVHLHMYIFSVTVLHVQAV